MDGFKTPRITLADRRMNASFGQDDASATAMSESGDQPGISAFYGNVSATSI